MLEYFKQSELFLAKYYIEIMKKNKYDFLTNLIFFESQLANIEGCIDELKEMNLIYSEVES